ncbi:MULTISPECIES: D-hexose-6-phosphate mutarotase [unclassified Acidovorax]|uniref:D-hexose-6-phosphate mutarotase n=1 Tax=unclassified Acidovorax TaxID=2684926 RepID=UPI002882DF00|nr:MULTISPECIES: D-hexose-6-phosphate mutarotase [unclassified Acidovorax]
MSAAPPSSTPTVREISFEDQPALQLSLPSGDAVVVALQGAQVLSWKPADGVERLYLSPRSIFDGQSAIRGGIPVCFPQFNQRGPLVKHGFARNLPWQLDTGATPDAQHAAAGVTAVLALHDSPQTREWWPHGFTARLSVTLTEGGLRAELAVQNTGDSAWDFTVALHSYLAVDNIAQTRLEGLDGCARWDSVADVHHVQQGAVTFDDEYDCVFGAPQGPLHLHGGATRQLVIQQSPSCDNTVVWNPGAELCARLADMPDDGFRHMLCVEAARIDAPITLTRGAQWVGWQQLQLP